MSIHLTALLAEPELGLELVAGEAGLAARGPLRWAHISEIPDPTPWLEGDEILLTTGLGVKDSPALQRALIAGLDRRGCAGVGFGVGIWLDEVPAAMVAEADARDLPLFTVPYEVPFIAVTKYVSSRVFAEHYAGLRRALDLHRRVLAVVTSSGGLDEVLAETVRSIGDAGAVVFDSFGHVLASAGDRRDTTDHDALWRALPAGRRASTQVEVAGGVASVTPLWTAGDVQAVMVVTTDQPLDDARQLLARQGAAAATVEVSRELSARRARRTSVAALLDDVQEGRVSHRRLAHALEQLGVDAAATYHVLTVLPDADRRTPVLAGLLEDMAAGGAVAAVGTADGVIHAIVQPGDAGLGAALVTEARLRGLVAPRVGRSRVQHDVDGLAVALRESVVAAERSRGGLLDVADLGVRGLLAGVGTDVAADAFVRGVLGPVLDHDADGDGALVETLRAYLRTGCRPGPAAARLRVHRHTLAYRLDRITALTGRDPRDGAHLLGYGLALEIIAERTAASRR
ncbi:MAG TPA: PucR family transcriptional regulator [Euzebyales bacterium]|nr:PucR family transcriptional regulator [Euzebyales bacterium]